MALLMLIWTAVCILIYIADIFLNYVNYLFLNKDNHIDSVHSLTRIVFSFIKAGQDLALMILIIWNTISTTSLMKVLGNLLLEE